MSIIDSVQNDIRIRKRFGKGEEQIYNIGSKSNEQIIQIVQNLSDIKLGQYRNYQQKLSPQIKQFQIVKFSCIKEIEDLNIQIAQQYLELCYKINPFTNKKYTLPNNQDIFPFFLMVSKQKNPFEQAKLILKSQKKNSFSYEKYFKQYLRIIISKCDEVLQYFYYKILWKDAKKLITNQLYLRPWQISSKKIIQYNSICINMNLNQLSKYCPFVDYSQIKLQQLLQLTQQICQQKLKQSDEIIFKQLTEKNNIDKSKFLMYQIGQKNKQ